MIFLVSTTRRESAITEPSGYLYAIDLERQQIVRRCYPMEPPLRKFDGNVRGGMRGCKGIAIRDDQIALSNYSGVYRFDEGWNFLGSITHPSCAGIHDIAFQGDTIWVTVSRADLLMQFELSGRLLRYVHMRLPSPLTRAMNWNPPILLEPEGILHGDIDFRDPRTHDDTYDRTHVNGVSVLSDDEILVNLGFILDNQYLSQLRFKKWLIKYGVWSAVLEINARLRSWLGMNHSPSPMILHLTKSRAAVVRLSEDGLPAPCLIFHNLVVPSHSLLVLPDLTAITLNTTTGEVVHFEPKECRIISSTKVTDGFLRGVTVFPDGRLVLGSQTELITFDLESLRVLDRMEYTGDKNEAVYDIALLPPHYSLPPETITLPELAFSWANARE